MPAVPSIATTVQSAGDTVLGVKGGVVKRFSASPSFEQLAGVSEFRESVSVKDFGAKGDGVTDDYDAIMAAISSVSANVQSIDVGGPIVFFPPGEYLCSKTIQIKRTVILEGASSGLAGAASSIIKFPANTTGIIVQRHNTIDDTTAPSTSGGDGSIIRNLRLSGTASGLSGHGIWMRARASVEHVQIYGFKENGLHIAAASDANQAPLGNCNCWRVTAVRVINCGGHGLYTIGADSNAGVATLVDAYGNGGWGVWDASFLGNSYFACHVSGNAGAYKASGGVSVFIGCYSESGVSSASEIASPSLAIGGTHGAGFSGSGPYLRGDAGFLLNTRGYLSSGPDGSETLSAALGGNPTNGDVIYAAHSIKAPVGYRLRFSGTGLRFDYGNSDTAVVYEVTGPTTARDFGRWPTLVPHAFVTNRLWIGANNGARYHGADSAAPTDGTWAKGDVIYNNAPSAGGFVGWVCTAGGTPGTWKTFGAISP